jgi:hypothetical protein
MRNKNTVIFHPRVKINKDYKALKYRQSSIDFNKKEEEVNIIECEQQIPTRHVVQFVF